MILQALYKLSEREKLLGEDVYYELKKVPWIVKIGEKGEFLGMIDNRKLVEIPPKTNRGKPRKEYRSRWRWVPREPERTSGDYAFFLCDTTEYLFGVNAPAKKEIGRSSDKLSERSRLFLQKVEDCFEETRDKGIEALLLLLKRVKDCLSTIKLNDECDTNDLITFVYAPDIDKLLSDRPSVRRYWANRTQAIIQQQPMVSCIVTGSSANAITKHPMLKRVPGGTPSGVAMVSFNDSAFESYGLTGNANAPISWLASISCATAMNRLLNPESPSPLNPDEMLSARNYKISPDTVVCFWTINDDAQDFCNQFAPILEANPIDVKEVYRSIWKGKMPPCLDTSAFYALTLSGTQGRAIVRDWFESTVRDAVAHISAYFADLNIVRNTPKPKERELPPQLPMTILLRSIAAQGKTEDIPPHIASQMIRAALSGKRYPITVFQRALERMRAEIGNDEWLDLERRDARAALIKAVLIRNFNLEVKREMDPTNKNEGYTLGCLMAVLERIQQEAIDNINANVIDRYFSGASAAPKSVFVRLMKNARNHVRKAKDNPSKAGVVFLMDRLLDELSERFNPEKGGFPSHLSLEDQGLFVIGYHQMRHWLWMPQEQRKEWELQYSCLPKAFAWSKS